LKDDELLDALLLDVLLDVLLDALLGTAGYSEMIARGVGVGDYFEMAMTMVVSMMHRGNGSSRSCCCGEVPRRASGMPKDQFC